MAKRFASVDYYDFAAYDGDDRYLYGFQDQQPRSRLARINKQSRTVETVYDFPATGASIRALVIVNSVTIVVVVSNVDTGGDNTAAIWHVDISGGLAGSAVVTKAADWDGGAGTAFDTLQPGGISKIYSPSLGYRIMAVSYSVGAGSYDLQIMMSTSATGSSFTEIAAVPNSFIRHFHMCQSAPDGRIWITVGDNLTQAAIIIWDPAVASTWPDLSSAIDWTTLNNTDGFDVLSAATTTHSDKRFRASNVVFFGAFAYWMVDEFLSSTDSVRGIWRINYANLSALQRVDSQIITHNGTDVARWGWVGAILNDQLVFTDYMSSAAGQGSNNPVANYCNYLYTSKTGAAGDWHVGGRINGINTGDDSVYNLFVRSMFVAGDTLYYSGNGMAGKGSSSNYDTVAIKLTDKPIAWDSGHPYPYDILHPVFYVDPGAGDNINNGWHPGVAFADMSVLGSSNKVSHGSGVVLIGDVVQSNRVTADWDTFANKPPYLDGNQPLQITGFMHELKTWTHSAGSTIALLFGTNGHNLDLSGARIVSVVASSPVLQVSTGVTATIAVSNNGAVSCIGSRAIRISNLTDLYVFRSFVDALIGGGATTACIQTSSSGGGSITVRSSVLSGGWTHIDILGEGTPYLGSNNVYANTGAGRAIVLSASVDQVPSLINEIFDTDLGGSLSMITDSAGLTWDADDVRSCWFRNNNNIPAFLSAIDSAYISGVVDPGLGPTYQISATSVLRRAGVTVTGSRFDMHGVLLTAPFPVGATTTVASSSTSRGIIGSMIG